jgi:hypothetical protein
MTRPYRIARPYTRESIQHALAHHESRGAVLSFTAPDTDPDGWNDSTWFVALPDSGPAPLVLSTFEAYALVLGLRAGETVQHADHASFIDALRVLA